MIRLRDIFSRHAPAYLHRFGADMPFSHLRTLRDIIACRTHAMGVHTEQCSQCGRRHLVPHSCRNRLCPACHTAEIQDWTAARARDVLPVRYHHLTFTLPSEYRSLVRRFQRDLEDVLLTAASETLRVLASDRLGGRIGVTAAIHTWGRSLWWHPHVHCLVPGLVILPDQTVKQTEPGFFLPVRAVSEVFRAVFLRQARRRLPGVPMPEPPGFRYWAVYSRPCIEGPGNVIRYLARYARRGPLDERCILHADSRRIVFRYRSHRTGKSTTCTLTPDQFLARYLQHTPPPGFRRLRYYGFLAPGARSILRAAQAALLPELAAIAAFIGELRAPSQNRPPHRCPRCGNTFFITFHFRGPATPVERPP